MKITEARKTSKYYKALGHPKRLQIYTWLSENKAMTNMELLKKARISKANLSQHLKELRETGLILTVKEGRNATHTVLRAGV